MMLKMCMLKMTFQCMNWGYLKVFLWNRDGTYQLRYSEYTMDLICTLSFTDNKYIDGSPHVDENIEQRFYNTVNKITRKTLGVVRARHSYVQCSCPSPSHSDNDLASSLRSRG